MKKITVVILVVAMLVLSTVPAFAAGGPSASRGSGTGICTGDQVRLGTGSQARSGLRQASFGNRNSYALSGTISAINTDAKTVTVKVACGNWMVTDYIGADVTLQTNEYTRFLLRNADGTVTPITFAELSTNVNISSHGTLVDGVWTASRITAGALLTCLK